MKQSKKPQPRNFKSKIPIPKGFAPDREKSGRICYRCLHVTFFGDGMKDIGNSQMLEMNC